ncbi:MAG: UDP-N-acetylmuramoyl-L-alanyl-D-glutamate--2,6-diaminopimelate ligase [Clostridia bacterium]
MKIKNLLTNVEIIKTLGDIDDLVVENLNIDTKNKSENSMFFCIKGGKIDSHGLATAAKEGGAICLVCERAVESDLPQIIVKDSRHAMAIIAGNFFDDAHKKLHIIGISGTNGKTTTSFLTATILKQQGYRVGIIGTEGIFVNEQFIKSDMTTPDPIVLHRAFKTMVDNNCQYVVMEVSAHSIALSKIDGILFDVGVVTNITQDHLDFFKTMDNYAKTKISFLTKEHVKSALINADDERLAHIYENLDIPSASFGILNPSDVFAVDLSLSINGSKFVVNAFDEIFSVNSPLAGDYNVQNCLTAISICKMLGVSAANIAEGIGDFFKPPNPFCDVSAANIAEGIGGFKEVPGRFNIVQLENNITCIIDYAHTPDGLEKILKTVKNLCKGNVICVFGCGGNRDSAKRPIMGQIAEKLCDFVVITSDNPRFEKPREIMKEIEKGFSCVNYCLIEDREAAIAFAVRIASPDDAVVVCGKGAENYIDRNGIKTPYSDFDSCIKAGKEDDCSDSFKSFGKGK